MCLTEQICQSTLKLHRCRRWLQWSLNRSSQDVSVFRLLEYSFAIFGHVYARLRPYIVTCNQLALFGFASFLGMCRLSGLFFGCSNRFRQYDRFVIYGLVEGPISPDAYEPLYGSSHALRKKDRSGLLLRTTYGSLAFRSRHHLQVRPCPEIGESLSWV